MAWVPFSLAEAAHSHQPGSRRAHDDVLIDYGPTPQGVRDRFADYLATYDATA